MRPAEARHAEGAMANSRAAETRHAEGASTPQASAARREAHSPAASAKAPTVAAEAATVPAKAPPCVGLKREKRNDEEQRRDGANASHRRRALGARRPRGRRTSALTSIPPLGELSRRLRRGRLTLGISPRTESF